jgi:predicted RNA methylase
MLLYAFYTEAELKNKVVTDGTSCIGGNVIELAKNVKSVNSIDIDPLHVEISKHNTKLLNINNIDFSVDNYIFNFDKYKQDIIFLDPPWGGVDYKKKNLIDLYMINSNIPFSKFITSFISYLCEVIVLKLPYNYNVDLIISLTNTIYNKKLVINSPNGNPLYIILILSNIKPIDESKLITKTFNRIGYKYINYQTYINLVS